MFKLRAHLSDGFEVNLDERFPNEQRAIKAADQFVRDYSDPCGLNVHVAWVSVIDCDLEAQPFLESE